MSGASRCYSDDRCTNLVAAHRSVEGGVEREDSSVLRGEPVTVAVRSRNDADHRLVELPSAHGPVEPGVTEREDAAVGRGEPITLAVPGRGHPDHSLVDPISDQGSVEAGVAESEDPAVGRDEPITLSVRRRGHPDNRLSERPSAHGSIRPGVAEREDVAVGRDEPVTLAVRRCGYADHWIAELATHGSVRPGVTEAVYSPSGSGEPVTLSVRSHRNTHDGLAQGSRMWSEGPRCSEVVDLAAPGDEIVQRGRPRALRSTHLSLREVPGEQSHGQREDAKRRPREHPALDLHSLRPRRTPRPLSNPMSWASSHRTPVRNTRACAFELPVFGPEAWGGARATSLLH